MKVVVTGGSGFVGSHTIKALLQRGYQVFNYDLLGGYDIRNREQFYTVIEHGDKILHLAAVARFADADRNPIEALGDNVIGCQNVARIAALKGAERIVYSSTGSVYMPIEQEPPITESFRAQGNSQYAVTKYQGELMIRNQTTPWIILRYAHLYGEGKIGHGAIGGFIARMERGLKPQLYGGMQSNDFTYIEDIVQANLLALESPHLREIYNIGTGEELTTEGVFTILSELFKYRKEFEKLPARTVDPLRFVYDITKAKKLLGFYPKYNFRDGMQHWIEKGIKLS